MTRITLKRKTVFTRSGTGKSKYKARKTVIDGITFDSEREARRWQQLRLLERSGAITYLQRQVTYVLAPKAKLYGEERTRPAIRYVVDFQYVENGETVLEDSKGVDTPVSRLKRHLMKTVHGLDVRIV